MKFVRETLDEQVTFDYMKPATQHIKKDIRTQTLDKKVIYKLKDAGGEEVLVCAVNGDFVRDKDPGLDFDQFVDGGHHYVTSYPGYKKHIPENEIWIDDVFETKPNDMRAIFLHEYIERNLMKYKHYTYDKAHNYANKKEIEYRARVKK